MKMQQRWTFPRSGINVCQRMQAEDQLILWNTLFFKKISWWEMLRTNLPFFLFLVILRSLMTVENIPLFLEILNRHGYHFWCWVSWPTATGWEAPMCESEPFIGNTLPLQLGLHTFRLTNLAETLHKDVKSCSETFSNTSGKLWNFLFVYLLVCLSVCPSVRPSIHPSIFL